MIARRAQGVANASARRIIPLLPFVAASSYTKVEHSGGGGRVDCGKRRMHIQREDRRSHRNNKNFEG